MNDSERVAKDWQDQRYRQLVQDMRPGVGSSKPNYAPGGGIGNKAGWIAFASMIGAISGGIIGTGFVGALIGAAVFAVMAALVGALSRGSSGGGAAVSRTSVILWALGGAAAGAIIGAIIGGNDPERAANAIVNWGLLGMLLLGGYRLFKRLRSKP